jgi:hypothetical protein
MCVDPPESQELRNHRIDYINQRWKQLHGLEKECADIAIKYLFLTNSGGAVTVLSFMGASEKARSSSGAIISLSCFVAGVILVGVFNTLRYYRVAKLFYSWKRDSEKYFDKKVEWPVLIQSDEKRSRTQILAHIIGHCSFIAFLAGCIFGMINLFK